MDGNKNEIPDYRIDVVTEITNGVRTFYLLKIEAISP